MDSIVSTNSVDNSVTKAKLEFQKWFPSVAHGLNDRKFASQLDVRDSRHTYAIRRMGTMVVLLIATVCSGK